MMILVHAKAGQTVAELPVKSLNEKDLVALIGPDVCFEGLGLTSVGKVGGMLLRVTQLQGQDGTFSTLADCARLLHRLFVEQLGPLHYVQPTSEQLPDIESAPVAWTSTPDGHVDAFRLSAMVASSPLLMPLTRDLATRSMTDDRRFAFLAAAFSGV